MIIAFCVILGLFVAFIVVSYFMMKKTFKTEINGKEVLVKNAGGYIKVYVDQKLDTSFYMPDLIKGETIPFKVDETEYNVKCKSNSMGYKMQIQIYQQDNLIASNGVEIKEKKQKQN